MYTFTFAESAENHVGMQQLGQRAPEGGGLQLADLQRAQELALERGEPSEMFRLDELADAGRVPSSARLPPAAVLVLRGAAHRLAPPADWRAELQTLRPLFDRQARMRGRVVNKHARWNLCLADQAQEPDYAAGRGRVVRFADFPLLARLRDWLPSIFERPDVPEINLHGLYGEANLYYRADCGIGFHGDTERRIVIGARLADGSLALDMPLHFQWYRDGAPVLARMRVPLQPGDVYVMSEKAAGGDWKRRSVPTLRHATGAAKYTA